MKTYIRTEDGRIVDVAAFIKEEKDTRCYKDYVFDEIENRDGKCYIHWTAVGTRGNYYLDQIGRRCDFEAYIDSPFIRQSDMIEELCDEFVFVDESGKKDLIDDNAKAELQEYGTFSAVHAIKKQNRPKELYGAVWTDKGLIYVAKMNEKLELELS